MLKRFLQRWLGIQELSDRQTRIARNNRTLQRRVNIVKKLSILSHQNFLQHLVELHGAVDPTDAPEVTKGYERV